MATYVICDEDPQWNADAPVAEWKSPVINALAATLLKVAREGTDEQRQYMQYIGSRLVDLTTTPAPKARRRRSTK
jgi:hypothetical protein